MKYLILFLFCFLAAFVVGLYVFKSRARHEALKNLKMDSIEYIIILNKEARFYSGFFFALHYPGNKF